MIGCGVTKHIKNDVLRGLVCCETANRKNPEKNPI